MNDILVSISCITYNHAAYISQCLDGFVSQKTNFKYEILIHDDCSTDGTDEIIKRYAEQYPDIIKPLFEEVNQYSQGKPIGTSVWNIPRAKGKYIAFCEGDDYWIDEYKLQKQVDYLEQHPEVGMCFTDFNRLYDRSGKMERDCLKNNPQMFPKQYTLEQWIEKAGYVGPMTWMVKKELWEAADEKSVQAVDGSFVLFTYFLAHSKVACLNDTTAVYRILENSASHDTNLAKLYKRIKGLHYLQLLLADKFLPTSEAQTLKERLNRYYYNATIKLIVAMYDQAEFSVACKYLRSAALIKLYALVLRSSLLKPLYKCAYVALSKSKAKFRPH